MSGEKGLLIVHTGAGKGKSTAAFGMILRAAGHNMRSALIQFGKGSRVSGERLALGRFQDLVEVAAYGQGFSWESKDEGAAADLALAAWDHACRCLDDPAIRLVVLDEIAVAIGRGHLDEARVMERLLARPAATHVVATGRDAPLALVAAADLVTGMEAIKHPYRDGVPAQAGIEF